MFQSGTSTLAAEAARYGAGIQTLPRPLSRVNFRADLPGTLINGLFEARGEGELLSAPGLPGEYKQTVECKVRFGGAAPDVIDALGQYGDAIGIAFQIADDYLDLWGDESSIGKTLGTDLHQGKTTLPVIRMLSTSNEQEKRRIVEVLTGPANRRLSELLPMLQRCDARQYTRVVAEAYRDKAVKALDVLDDSSAKASLIAIARFAVDRRF